jgi:cytochrome c biogenesis protein CcmG, thiol:disulfide interchange protein DsbE
MAHANPAPEARRSWLNVVLLLGASVLFGAAVLPRLQPAASRLRGMEAPDFALPVVYGGLPDSRVRLSELRGKAVVLDFWASWCGVCRTQAPILDGVARKFQGENVVVIGVNTGDRPDQAVAFARSRGLSYASVLDDGSVAAAYRANALPTLVVVGRTGKIAEIRQGLVRAAELERLLRSALSS